MDTGLESTFEIEYIERDSTKNQWAIVTQQADMDFSCDGFEQFIRQEPSFQFEQIISYKERNGYSLDRVTNQETPNIIREEILEQRRKDFEHYENLKKRQAKKLELEELIKSRDKNEIDTKEYLLKKKEINELLFSYNFFLRGTRFENW